MGRILRLLVGVAAAGVLAIVPLQAWGAAAFRATISPNCVSPGGQVTISIPDLPAGTAVGVRGDFAIASGSGNVIYGSATAGSSGTATVQLTVPTNAASGSLTLFIFVSGNNKAAYVGATVRIAVGTTACPSPGELLADGAAFNNVVSNSVKKTCDSGVTGNAIFALTYVLGEGGSFHMPAVTVACNGAAVVLPGLPDVSGGKVVLHETTVPTGGVAAADATAQFDEGTVTINNAKAAATATPTPAPTPTPHTLPATGGASHGNGGVDVAVLMALVLLGLGGSLALISRKRPTI